MRKLFQYLFFLLVLPSCIEVVNLDVEQVPHELVINCLFTENEPFVVNVSRLAPYPDLEDRNIESAIVEIYENEELKGILNHTEDGIYTNALFVPSPGNIYSIRVQVEDYPTVTASDTLPKKVFIDGCTYKSEAGIDNEGDYYDEIAVSFTDSLEETFYSIQIFNYVLIDEYQKELNYWYPIDLSTNDPVILAEGITQNDYQTYFVFNDALFSNQSNMVTVRSVSYFDSNDKFRVMLEAGTEHYYQYKKRLLKHESYSYQDPFKPYSPVPLYSNVFGGQGIFAGFQRDIFLLTFPN